MPTSKTSKFLIDIDFIHVCSTATIEFQKIEFPPLILQPGQSFDFRPFKDSVDLENDHAQGICGEKIMTLESGFDYLTI